MGQRRGEGGVGRIYRIDPSEVSSIYKVMKSEEGKKGGVMQMIGRM